MKTTYPIDKITENGTALCHIVIAANADEQILCAAQELAYHIKKVSGAVVPVVNEPTEGSLPIIIASPEEAPELETLFPNDLLWLRTLSEENGRNWGSDGFSVQLHEGKLYIFGAKAKGALNGTFDFIEKNMDVLWVRVAEDYGLIYDEMPTIPLTNVNYREKSPFEIRGWTLAMGNLEKYDENLTFFSRNKLNTNNIRLSQQYGMDLFRNGHNVKRLVYESPLYDPEVTEYWNTNEDGTFCTKEDSVQINFFSDKAADAVAASILKQLNDGVKFPFIGMEDCNNGRNIPFDTQPLEYAPGQFVEPEDPAYESTLFFSFINKVAKQVKSEFPGRKIATFAYYFSEEPPKCAVEDNVFIVMAPIREDLAYPLDTPDNESNRLILDRIKAWHSKVGGNMVFYNYYGCFRSGDRYTRPIWDRIKEHLSFYRDCGFFGLTPEGQGDNGSSYIWYYTGVRTGGWLNEDHTVDVPKAGPNSYFWAMNAMPFWIYAKLSWNPDENVDELIVKYCDKVYGAASEAMQEYYRLVKLGWESGKEDLIFKYYSWSIGWTYHMECYLFNKKFDDDPATENLVGRILSALDKAMALADGRAKEHIAPILKQVELTVEEYKQFLEAYPDAEVGTHTVNIVRQ